MFSATLRSVPTLFCWLDATPCAPDFDFQLLKHVIGLVLPRVARRT
jgi:hypothetical protein